VGAGVEILDTFDGEPILVRQRNVVGATFHPELTGDATVARLAFEASGSCRSAA
jgi:5'-phosphate synthase pdxT subunit